MKTPIRNLIIALAFTSSISASAQVPLLSSHPSAPTVLFLDFDGHTVANTSWNYSGPIYCDGSGLNNTQITEIFNRVSEDYRPFNINITTDSAKYWAAPVNKRMRIILTTSSSWYGSAGGVSFVGSFIWGDNTPCFIFTALLGYNTKYISEAVSHESGHTLGLYHQAQYNSSCGLITQYYAGAGAGETSWAPIMGIGYYKNTTTWYNGPNPYGCSNTQDDLSILTSASNGISYRTDDFGDTFGTATNKTFSANKFSINGLISTSSDKDMFKFTLTTLDRFQVNVDPTSVGAGDAGSNLDISVRLYNSATASINFWNPPTTLNVAIDTVLSPGTYYMLIDAVGNDYTPKYGSLGSYAVAAQETPVVVLALRKLELHGAAVGSKHQFDWTIDADDQVTDQSLEISTDGENFNPVGHLAVDAHTFSYTPNVSSTVQYRLKVTLNNERQYYSNIVSLRSAGSSQRPHLVSNFINTSSIMVNSPGNYSYAVYDFTGKIINKGQLNKGLNSLNASGMNAGMYIIRFVGDSAQWTDKLIRQ